MDLFQTHYRSYYTILSIMGLWPFDVSTFANIKRLCFALNLLSCTIIQFTFLATSEITSTNVLMVLSCNGPALLFFTQYVVFIINFSHIKVLVEIMQTDCSALQNPVELGILTTHINTGIRVFMVYLCVSCIGIIFMNIMLLEPIVLDFAMPVNKSRYRTIRDFGFLLHQSTHSDLLTLYVVLIITIGLLGIACSESMLAIAAHYTCGLFKIASYRIRTAVLDIAKSTRDSRESAPNLRKICLAVDVHRRAIRIVMSLLIMYISQLFLALQNLSNLNEIIPCTLSVLVHVIIIFLNNHSGQLVIDYSTDVCNETYDSMWYCTPVSAQKLLLVIMQRSSVVCQCSIYGFLTPCFKGFSAMMSTSFSYFTVLCSIR